MADLTTVAYIVKKLYGKKEPENLATRDRVLLSMLDKMPGFYGSNLTIPVKYGNPMGVSKTFATAQTNAGQATSGIAWTVTRSKMYGVATIDAEAMLATQDNTGAFVRMVQNEIDGVIDEVGHQLAIAMYGDGSMSIGQSNSTASPVTLVNADDAKNFSVNQKITANPTKTGTVGNMRSGTGTVTAVNEDTGVITYSGTITSLAANDYFYTEGNYDAAFKGLAGHFPLTAPSNGDSFYGVDRSVNTNRLAGWRVTTTSNSIEENIVSLAALIYKGGGRRLSGFVNHTNWTTLVKNLGSKALRDPSGKGTFGYSSVAVDTAAGTVPIYADPECPNDRGYLLEMDSLHLQYLGPGLPHIVRDDKNDWLRQTSADGIEVRIRAIGNMYSTAPGHNGVFQIS